jgi:hypothetical protein
MLFLVAILSTAACVQGRPAADSGDPGFPFGPTAVGVQRLAYVPDIKPILDSDCLRCHNSFGDQAADYSVSTLAAVTNRQTPGDARSPIVVDCSPGGSMYRYLSGDATTKATMIFRWMVVDYAAASR